MFMKVLTCARFRPVVTYFYREMYCAPTRGGDLQKKNILF